MRKQFDKTPLEKLADAIHSRVYWLRCVLSTGHDPDREWGPVAGGRTICNNCGRWCRYDKKGTKE